YFGQGDARGFSLSDPPNNVTDDVDNIDNFLATSSVGQHATPSCGNCAGNAVCITENGQPICKGEGYGSNQWWYLQSRVDSLIQMYDLLASIDTPEARDRANVYLERVRQMANAYLKNRDDKRTGFPVVNQSPYPGPPYDTFHHRVMPGWGQL